MRILVCGGRRYSDRWRVFGVLDHYLPRVTAIIHGDAPGADRLAEQWCYERGVPMQSFPAQWETHGDRAGPIRNAQMLADGKPDLVVAFPGGHGTADMVRRAMDKGVAVLRVDHFGKPGFDGTALPQDFPTPKEPGHE